MSESGLKPIIAQEGGARPEMLPSPALGAWLWETGGSLAFTTYQSARVFFLSGLADGGTVALDRIVGSAMGMATQGDALWITNKEQAWRFANVGPRRLPYQGEDTDFDAVYMPRWGILLGACDTHDILIGTRHKGRVYELLFVNTNFSCVAAVDGHYSFVPVWKPPFLDAFGFGDQCHLNGMAAKDGQLTTVTACAETAAPGSWRDHKKDGGVVIDVPSNEIFGRGFSMPHSPRWHKGKLWLLDSGNGTFGTLDPASGKFEVIAHCPGFARGLTFIDNFAVIGLSQLRPNTFASGLPIKQKLEDQGIAQRCGLLVVDITSGKVIHWLSIASGITELYDVVFLPGIRRPFTPGFSEPELHRRLLNLPTNSDIPFIRAAAPDNSDTP